MKNNMNNGRSSKLRTSPHKNYIPPTTSEIEEEMKKLGLETKGYQAIDITQDMINAMSFEYLGDDIVKSLIPLSELDDNDFDYNRKIQQFVTNIDYSEYPGSPLQKVICAVKHFTDNNPNAKCETRTQEGKKNSYFENYSESDIKEIAKQMKSEMKAMKEANKESKELSDVPGNQGGSGNEWEYDEAAAANFINMNAAERQSFDVGAKLDQMVNLKVGKKKTKIVDKTSKVKRLTQMSTHSQITKVKKSAFAKPNFKNKFYKKELNIKEGFKTVDQKQALMLLVDRSGSMNRPFKLAWRNAIVRSRLEAVAKDEAMLLFYHYVDKRYDREYIYNKEQALNFYQTYKNVRPHGGDTFIADVLQESIDECVLLKESMDGHTPEIMIICDGEDKFDGSIINQKGVKVHVVLLGKRNRPLESFAKTTGGTTILVNEQGKMI